MINIKKKIVVCIIISIIWIYTGNQAILFTGTDVQMFDLMKKYRLEPKRIRFRIFFTVMYFDNYSIS